MRNLLLADAGFSEYVSDDFATRRLSAARGISHWIFSKLYRSTHNKTHTYFLNNYEHR
jgi:hypothetical protein